MISELNDKIDILDEQYSNALRDIKVGNIPYKALNKIKKL